MNMANVETATDDLVFPGESWGIFLVSILGLFLEMLFIRWIGTEIRIFAYLQNTILVVCFLGMGLGMFTSSRKIELKQSLIPLVILLLLMAIPATRTALGSASELLSASGGLVIWYGGTAGDAGVNLLYLITGLILTFVVLILIVDTFVPIGRILGRLMNASPNSIQAYSINVFGSILGTWSFVVLGYFYQPPFVWFLIAGALLLVMVFWSQRDRRLNVGLLALAVVLSWFAGLVPGAMDVIWSPYQKLTLRDSRAGEIGKYVINVNNVGYQAILDLSDENVSSHPEEFPPEMKGLSQYDLPLLFHPNPHSFLVVGAGSGNDVAGALRHDVRSIVAIEIDPAIIEMGRSLHPEKPYSFPNVLVVNDDARSFFATTTEKYDVVSFGLLDSHTTTAMTNARLDHYVYTKESIAQARTLLADGGVMVLTFEAQKPFIADRMQQVLEDVFGQEPLVFRIPANSYGWGGVMFVTGDMENVQTQLDSTPALAAYIQELQETDPVPAAHTTKVTTDDWPYIYLEAPKIPPLYYMLIGLMGIIFARSYYKWKAGDVAIRMDRTFWHFFFLGTAFLLLEVQNISKASVVLGNTWEVNAVIISSILGMALLANWIVIKFLKIPIAPVYFLLIATSLSLYFVDLARFGFLPYFTKAIVIGVLTSLPMLFSGIVFTRSFAAAADRSNALGANLIGALCGALLQSITFITGIKALLLIVAGFYLLSLLTSSKNLEKAGNHGS
jgi:spermidine synthase